MKINLMLELTNRCTLRCPTCFSHLDTRDKIDLSFDSFKNIIDENFNFIQSLSLYNYGEPFLNKYLPAMIAYAKSKGVPYVKVATNGMHLTPQKINNVISSQLDCLSISLDGATKETYETFRIGGHFQKIISNIKKIVIARNSAKSHLKIEIQFIIMSHNEHEIEAIETLSKCLKVDRLRLKTVLIRKDRWKKLLPVDSKYNRYSHKEVNSFCFKPLNELVINSNGTVIPCCYIVGNNINKFSFGNIFDQSLKNIINSNKYKSFVRTCTTHKSKLSSCKNCYESSYPLDYKLINFTNAK